MNNKNAILSVDLFIDQDKCDYFDNTAENIEQFLNDQIDCVLDEQLSNTVTIVLIDEEHYGSISHYIHNINVWFNEQYDALSVSDILHELGECLSIESTNLSNDEMVKSIDYEVMIE